MYNDFRRCLAILEGDRIDVSFGEIYPNVSELSLFGWHIIHVFKNMVTERSKVNIRSYTRDHLFTHKLLGNRIAINQSVCIIDMYYTL